MRYFSNRDRPFHLGPFPLEKLVRTRRQPRLETVPSDRGIDLGSHDQGSIAHAIARFLAMMDTVRDDEVNSEPAEIPGDPQERSRHFKAASYYFDASMVGIARLEQDHLLRRPRRNPMIDGIRQELEAGQPVTYAAGVDAIYADTLAAARRRLGPIDGHGHAIVMLVEYTREPRADEPGTEWFHGTQAERAALLSANAAVVIASYLRTIGFSARAHSATTSDVELTRLRRCRRPGGKRLRRRPVRTRCCDNFT